MALLTVSLKIKSKMERISYVELAKTIEGDSENFTLIEVNQTGYDERSMHADHDYQVVFKVNGNETPYICDVTFPFNIYGELWLDMGWGGDWFLDEDKSYPEGIEVHKAKTVTTIKYEKV
jgi:hypothetical protein